MLLIQFGKHHAPRSPPPPPGVKKETENVGKGEYAKNANEMESDVSMLNGKDSKHITQTPRGDTQK